MAFAQLTHRESLRDIEVCLGAHRNKLFHCGFSAPVKRSTLADANESRDWRIYGDFAQSLIRTARRLYAHSELGLELAATTYAFDSTTIDLCLSLFPWAQFRRHKSAVKLHTLLEIHSAIPVFIVITSARVHDVNLLDALVLEPGSIVILDRGYIDFERLYRLRSAFAFFIVRAKGNLSFNRRCSHPHDRATGVRSDQTIILRGQKSLSRYPDTLRRIHYYSVETDQRFIFLTNNFSLPAPTVAALYHDRWRIELFFKWIKQHLRIKNFFGTSENSVKIQVWTAVSVYVLVAIIKKRLDLKHDLYTILRTLSLTLFEKTPIFQLFQNLDCNSEPVDDYNQLKLMDI